MHNTEQLDGKCDLELAQQAVQMSPEFHDTHLRPRCRDEDRGNQDLINMISREAVTGGVHGSTSHGLPYEDRSRGGKRTPFGTWHITQDSIYFCFWRVTTFGSTPCRPMGGTTQHKVGQFARFHTREPSGGGRGLTIGEA
jgi:hypothetical protein